jgi:hypothetical protein
MPLKTWWENIEILPSTTTVVSVSKHMTLITKLSAHNMQWRHTGAAHCDSNYILPHSILALQRPSVTSAWVPRSPTGLLQYRFQCVRSIRWWGPERFDMDTPRLSGERSEI